MRYTDRLPLLTDWNLDASVTLAKLGISQTVTGGSFVGGADLGNGTINGNLVLPSSSINVNILGINLADVGFAVTPLGATTGTFDLATWTVSITSSLDIKIPFLRPLGLSRINLVGDRCQTAEPITLTMSGPIDLANPSTFTGEFTIPRFRNCGLLTFASTCSSRAMATPSPPRPLRGPDGPPPSWRGG